jgi:CRISPR-associated protein Csm4
MTTKIYKLAFPGSLHLGEGSLEDGGISLHADTLFSALAVEAVKSSGCETLVAFAKEGFLRLSDAHPYIGDTLFLPKPMMALRSNGQGQDPEVLLQNVSAQKKAFKKMKYIRAQDVDAFLAGTLKPDDTVKMLHSLGKSEVMSKAAVRTGGDAEPWHIGVFRFAKEAGLYFAATGSEDATALLEQLLDGLAKSGIGGKRSAGMGRFSWHSGAEADADVFTKRFGDGYERYLSISVALPKESEMDAAMVGAGYMLLRRGGFVGSDTYADGAPVRKNDIYVFAGGSVFQNRFEGDVYDVGGSGAHPVYRYAKPMFIGIGARRNV